MPRDKKKEEKIALVIRLTPKERLLAEKLAKYLNKAGILKRDSINELVRYSILLVGYLVAKQVEEKRAKEQEGEKVE